jgi:hypothetical protein
MKKPGIVATVEIMLTYRVIFGMSRGLVAKKGSIN